MANALNKAYVSAIALLDEREINPAVIDIHNEEGLTDIMDILGRYVRTKMAIYYNYVSGPLRILGDTTGATVTGSGTAAVTTRLTAATSGYVRKNDMVKFPNGGVGYVFSVSTSANQDTIVINSVNGTNLTHTAAQKLAFFSNAVGEASDSLVNRKTSMTQYFNLVQKFREYNETTDVAKVSPVVVEFNGQNFYHVKELAQKFIKLKGDVNGALIGGRRSVTQYSDATPAVVDPTGGGAMQFTGGLDEYVVGRGANDTGAAAGGTGAYALTDLARLQDAKLALKAPLNYLVLTNSKVRRSMDNCFKNLSGSGISSARLDVNGKEVNMSVEKFVYGDFSYQLKTLPILNNPDMFSQTDINKSAYFIPTGKVQTVLNGEQDRIQIRYQDHGITANNKGNAIWAEWHTGAAAPAGVGATGTKATWETHWLTTQGLEVLGAEHFAKQIIL